MGGRLISWKPQRGPLESRLLEAAAGAAGEQAQIVAHLGELHRSPLHDAAEHHEGASIRSGLDEVARELHLQAGDGSQFFHHGLGIAGIGADARADGGAAHVHFQEETRRFPQAVDVLAGGDREGLELLAQGHGHITSLNSTPLACSAAFSFSSAPSSPCSMKMVARRTAVGYTSLVL